MIKRKDNTKLYSGMLLALSVLCFLTILFVGTFSGLVFNPGYYNELHQRTGTYERLNKSIADQKTSEVLAFFKGKEVPGNDFFTPDEISHLDDVRILIKNVFLAYYLALALLLSIMIIFYMYFRDGFSIFLMRLLFFTGISTIIITLLFFALRFTALFDAFHTIFFTGNYSFPPASKLIKLFDEQFFYLFARKIFTLTILKGMVCSVFGGVLLYRKKKALGSSAALPENNP